MDELLIIPLAHWYNIYYYLLVVLCLCVEDDMYDLHHVLQRGKGFGNLHFMAV